MKKMIYKVRKAIIFLSINLLIVLILLLFIEGLASFVLFFQTIANNSTVAERSHTQYDERLGWVNSPNVYIEDMYGPGLYLKTNAQGFRNDEDFDVAAPDHKIRIICSGDSFTLGYGVDNRHTWCHLLETMDQQFQTVNMGQGGYGIDQAYLWYKRDGVQLEHDIHLFAFITADIERMQQDNFFGYGKPLLRVENGDLVVDNIPVPQRAFYAPWLTQNSEAIKGLKSFQLLSQLFQAPVQANSYSNFFEYNLALENVAIKILQGLQQHHTAQESLLVLVYLPTLQDYSQPYPANTERWRQHVYRAAQENSIIFVDMIGDFRALSAAEVQALFIHEGEVEFPGAAGHYSEQGNAYIARQLYQKLLSFPEVSDRLAKTRP
jgi:hypothetical protein